MVNERWPTLEHWISQPKISHIFSLDLLGISKLECKKTALRSILVQKLSQQHISISLNSLGEVIHPQHSNFNSVFVNVRSFFSYILIGPSVKCYSITEQKLLFVWMHIELPTQFPFVVFRGNVVAVAITSRIPSQPGGFFSLSLILSDALIYQHWWWRGTGMAKMKWANEQICNFLPFRFRSSHSKFNWRAAAKKCICLSCISS